MKEYKERIIDKEITKQMKVAGAILVRGPKWCGKTTTCKQRAKSFIELQDEEVDNINSNALKLAEIKPSLLLEGAKPRLIDEWQLAPKIWNTVRHSVDESGKKGEYFLTGSATPNELDTKNLHSGAGRFAFINMKTMSLFESGESNGKISLSDIVNGNRRIDGVTSDITYEKMAFLICRGGWPDIFNFENEEDSLEISKNYVNAVCESDVSRIDGVSRNPFLTRQILQSYARLVSTIESNQTLIDDVIANNNDISDRTIIDYISALKKLYIVDEIPAWNPNIRSKTAIRATPKKSFVDPSLATALLSISPKELMLDPNTYGLLFENLVDRDLSIYINSIGGTLSHYRDRYGLECDEVAHFNNGKYGLIETKIGSEKSIEEAEKHLLELKKLISENDKLREPDFLMIITNTKMAYTTENDVMVVPIGCLKDCNVQKITCAQGKRSVTQGGLKAQGCA